jgi:hypothetical protein
VQDLPGYIDCVRRWGGNKPILAASAPLEPFSPCLRPGNSLDGCRPGLYYRYPNISWISILNAKRQIVNSGRLVMGRGMVMARGQRGGGGGSGQVLGGRGIINCAKQSQFGAFLGQERGFGGKAKPNKANSEWRAGGGRRETGGQRTRGGGAIALRASAPNKANCPRFWAENGGWGGKQSQFDRLRAKPGNPKHEARNSKQMPSTKWTMTQTRPPGGRGDWDVGFGAVWEGMGGRIGEFGRLGREPEVFRGCLLVAYGLESRV